MSVGGIGHTHSFGGIEKSDSGENKISNKDPENSSKVSDKITLNEIGTIDLRNVPPSDDTLISQEKHSILDSIAQDFDKDGYTDNIDGNQHGKDNGKENYKF